MDLQHFRRQYLQGGLRRQHLHDNPTHQFQQWFQELLQLDLQDPTAMVLATVDGQQRPHQRTVLLKQVDRRGFTFFTNKNSQKGRQMASNAQVGLHFPWHDLDRQVHVNGTVEALSAEESDDYFSSRPRESQWGAWALCSPGRRLCLSVSRSCG